MDWVSKKWIGTVADKEKSRRQRRFKTKTKISIPRGGIKLVKATPLRHKSRVKQKMMELLSPPTLSLPPHQNSSCYTGIQWRELHNRDSWMNSTARSSKGKKAKKKQGHWRSLKPQVLYNKNISHSPTPSWININPPKKGLLTSETVLTQRVSTKHSRKSAV